MEGKLRMLVWQSYRALRNINRLLTDRICIYKLGSVKKLDCLILYLSILFVLNIKVYKLTWMLVYFFTFKTFTLNYNMHQHILISWCYNNISILEILNFQCQKIKLNDTWEDNVNNNVQNWDDPFYTIKYEHIPNSGCWAMLW